MERVVTDIAAEVRDILVFHLGAEEVRLADDARLAEDLGADRLDLVEIAMSCEEQFDIHIPNHVATGLATVGDAVRFIQAQVTGTAGAGPAQAMTRMSSPLRNRWQRTPPVARPLGGYSCSGVTFTVPAAVPGRAPALPATVTTTAGE